MADQNLPTFNLKAVVQETGLKPDTLRAWERRYGLPQPQRSPGGHRLYSQRDVDILKWLVARQDEGLSISNAVDLWNRLESEGQDPLYSPEFRAPQPGTTPIVPVGGETIAELREAWIEAAMAFDEQRAEAVVSHAFAVYPPETVCIEVLQAGIAAVGTGWYQGVVTVQQEHFASALARRKLQTLLASVPPPIRPDRILAAAPPDEEHDFSLLLLTFLLRRQGWDVAYLGARVPIQHLEDAIDVSQPRLVISLAQQLRTAATLMEMAHALRVMNIPLAYGGTIFNLVPELRDRIAGHFLGEGIQIAPQIVEQILSARPPAMPDVAATSTAHIQAREHFRDRQPAVEARVTQSVGDQLSTDYLSVANQNLAHDIVASLGLGNMGFMGSEITWLEGLLANHNLPTELLPHYLNAYTEALQTELDERGEPVTSWFAGLV